MAQYFPTRWTVGEAFAGSFFDSLARKQANEQYEEQIAYRDRAYGDARTDRAQDVAHRGEVFQAGRQDRAEDVEHRGRVFDEGRIDRMEDEQYRNMLFEAGRQDRTEDVAFRDKSFDLQKDLGWFNAQTGRTNATANSGLNDLLKGYQLRELERAEQARSDAMRLNQSTVNPDGGGIIPPGTKGETSFLDRMIRTVTNPAGPAAGFGAGAIFDAWGPSSGKQEKNATTIANNLEPYQALANSFINMPPESQQAAFQSRALQEGRRDLINAFISLQGPVRGLTPEVQQRKLQEIDQLYRQITGGTSIQDIMQQQNLESAKAALVFQKVEGQ